MIVPFKQLPVGKKIYFASDFHLGAPNYEQSRQREDKIVRWLESIRPTAAAIFLVGDIFDFWFEYKHVVPKGYVRLLGKLAELTDSGIPIVAFTGNHDMWMFDYFTKELNIPVYRNPQTIEVNGKRLFVGHGDGLGPKDRTYKILKKVFANRLCQWLFARVHPNLGIGIANAWSGRSRKSNSVKDDIYLGENEWLLCYCRRKEEHSHHEYYIFGHRHLPLDVKVNEKSRYINLGEWVSQCFYAEFDGATLALKKFEE